MPLVLADACWTRSTSQEKFTGSEEKVRNMDDAGTILTPALLRGSGDQWLNLRLSDTILYSLA